MVGGLFALGIAVIVDEFLVDEAHLVAVCAVPVGVGDISQVQVGCATWIGFVDERTQTLFSCLLLRIRQSHTPQGVVIDGRIDRA